MVQCVYNRWRIFQQLSGWVKEQHIHVFAVKIRQEIQLGGSVAALKGREAIVVHVPAVKIRPEMQLGRFVAVLKGREAIVGFLRHVISFVRVQARTPELFTAR